MNTLSPAEPEVLETQATVEEEPPVANQTGKIFDVDCKLAYELHGDCDFLFQIHAFDGMGQELISETLDITPPLAHHVYQDPSVGHRFMRLHAQAGPLEIHYRARLRRLPESPYTQAREMTVAELPDEVLHNIMPTRYCESDLMAGTAMKLFGHLPLGYSRVQAICDWIHDHIDYKVGSSNATTTARDVFLQRAGVCRDFAHLGITFCRALNIPARLVVGYARFEDPPPDFHAVFEAFLGGKWITFDPTRMSPLHELIRIAMGRDAKDVAFATLFGPVRMVSMAPDLFARET
jgi:hypothetical protein